ncbi:MAG TPA: Plug domain-containing protein [Longimicrobiales bacterium]|nr:Plug domain-containing protein [Longimicrobiales bacterium]
MNPSASGRRRHGGARRTVLAGAILMVMLPARAAAQVPPPVPDPEAEPAPVAQDTVAADTAPRRPLVRFPDMPVPPGARFAGGEWVWDQDALLREGPTSLIDLLARIPGITTFRTGMFVQPEAAAGFGGTVGRVEIEVDGYILDPLAASTFDLAQFPLAQIREVRVQRRLGLLRLRIFTAAPETNQPLTRIEAGVGEPSANLFRGLLLAPHVLAGPLSAAIERLDTDGTGRAEPANIFSGWAKWSWTNGERGVQVELLRTSMSRLTGSPWPADRKRQDLVVRARNRFAPGIVAEVYGGRSALDESVPGVPVSDTLPPVEPIDRTLLQAGGRVALDLPEVTVGASLRYRDAEFLPRLEGGFDADVRIGPARLGGEARYATWDGLDATLFHAIHAEITLLPGASVFGEMNGGRRGAPDFRGQPHGSVITERSGWRAGASVSLGRRATGGAAIIGLEQDMARPFGLPFDSAGVPHGTEPARGFEAHGRLVIIPGWIAVESWITDWSRAVGWTYMPVRSWRTALDLHAVPLPSGNLELLGRMEASQRGSTLVPITPLEDGPTFATIPGYTRIDGYLQIRIIDVRAFIRWEDVTGQEIMDVPGRVQRGPRIFYGVKWNLWN